MIGRPTVQPNCHYSYEGLFGAELGLEAGVSVTEGSLMRLSRWSRPGGLSPPLSETLLPR